MAEEAGIPETDRESAYRMFAEWFAVFRKETSSASGCGSSNHSDPHDNRVQAMRYRVGRATEEAN